MSAYETAELLAQEIKESEELQEFLSAKEKVVNDQTSYNLVRAFKLKQLEIQQAQFFSLDILEEKQQELESLYSLMSLHPLAREYLEAEFKISRMIAEIQRILSEAFKDVAGISVEYENNDVRLS